ncbi:hypothetical protein [Synechococcus sp. CS-1332]|uniref:hypothetical protein n=1 Tax=Synechococcus sp. CS-1332 TaxID=2847972 RepID=UPI00223C50B6|nr:hypothetical protein [Synechococcus sp. CS-1332]MCT0207732.1 hypothetical protein [Synechococcus sp. CS-1332]
MNSDDFFRGVDLKLSSIATASELAIKEKAENLDFLKEVLSRLAPMANSYKEKLRVRDVHAEVNSDPSGITFTLRRKDGARRQLQLIGRREDCRIEITKSFTGDDGKDFQTTDGKTYDKSTWKDWMFEDKLQEVVNDFLNSTTKQVKA